MRPFAFRRFARKAATASCGAFFSAALASLPQPASALVWDWSFETNDDPDVEALGELITTDVPDSQGYYTIIGLTGERNKVAIEGLIPTGSPIPGNCLDVVRCFTSDNLLRLEDDDGQLTTHGFGVSFEDGTYANYFFASFLQPATYQEFYSFPPFDLLPPDTLGGDSELVGKFEAEPRLNPVPGPLPAAGAVMAFGWARKLRRRQQAGR
ncbi:MAG: PEP-CTERM sorting domain-containing protein [Cyanobacteriota bacterium]|nr:PEP-CTERM sorting domain-containing protein [Cyanobacteriota bacterium]